jgi:2-amino-4-hydroxy-6-hydroxymethyldihydropteridine diphosphokinase
MKKIVYLSLGSNLGERKALLHAAVERLRELGQVTAVSSLYETEPVDFISQPRFLNCAVALETDLMPKQLLARTQQIEHALGRRRSGSSPATAKGPRTIDIDILLFGQSVVDTANLVIPHPALHQRRFVLEPLAEIAPDARHPLFKTTVRQMREAVPREGQAVKRITE